MMTVELRDLKWAVIVSQHRSLRKAAETLNIRQSTLSRRLRDMEIRLGAQLFERSNGGTRMTIAGLEFYPHVVQRGHTRFDRVIAAGGRGGRIEWFPAAPAGAGAPHTGISET